MKVEPRGLERAHLARLLEREYGLTKPALAFLPVGEESFVYVAQEADGGRLFARLVEDCGQGGRLETAYTAVEVLAQAPRTSALVPPRRTRQGALVCSHRNYLVALFPFIEGRSLLPGASPADRERMAEIVATLHERDASAFELPREGLKNPFEDSIRRALARAESPTSEGNRYQIGLSDLLNTHRDNVEATLRKMDAFRAEEDGLVREWVLTHGEPHLDNFVKDLQGRLHLTDCGGLAVGPPERDLFAFSGPNFGGYLTHYLRRRTARLNPALFTFYFYRWALQEIADYATRILFRETGPEEDEHSWRALQPYLPTRHDEIARGVRELREVFARVSS